MTISEDQLYEDRLKISEIAPIMNTFVVQSAVGYIQFKVQSSRMTLLLLLVYRYIRVKPILCLGFLSDNAAAIYKLTITIK